MRARAKEGQGTLQPRSGGQFLWYWSQAHDCLLDFWCSQIFANETRHNTKGNKMKASKLRMLPQANGIEKPGLFLPSGAEHTLSFTITL